MTQAATTSAQENYGYQDNLPVDYGNQINEAAGATDYNYTTTQEQQYTSTSTHEVVNDYQHQGQVLNVPAPEQFQHSHSAAQLTVDQGGSSSYHESYQNVVRTSSASAVDVAPLHCTNPIDVLDATLNPNWQRTDTANLVRRYGRPAYDIVQRTDQTEQQMYQELRQRNSSGGVQRSESAASYGSGSGIGANSAGFGVNSGSYTKISITIGNSEGIHQDTSPVCVNY